MDSREHRTREKLEIWSSTDNVFKDFCFEHVWRNLVSGGRRDQKRNDLKMGDIAEFLYY